MSECQSDNNSTLFFLDTNAFYDFCYVLGFDEFGFKTGINQRVNYEKFKSFIEIQLESRRLFIPSTTLFEFVCKLRIHPDVLENVLSFLKRVSIQYGYNLFQYHNYGILFMLDQYESDFWKDVQSDYLRILDWQDKIMLAKIGAEAEVVTIFSKSITHLYLCDYYKDSPQYKATLSFFTHKLFFNFFGDVTFEHCKKVIAHRMHDYYKIGKECEIKKDIVEWAIDSSADIMMVFFSDFNIDEEDYKKGIFESKTTIQNKIHKWYNKDKDKQLLDEQLSKFECLLKSSGFNDSQLCYFRTSMYNLFMQGARREKNDAEDFWCLGFVKGSTMNLITFELEIINAIKQTNTDNFQTIADFYELDSITA